MIAVYATIWLSLAGLLAGELGRRRHRQSGVPAPLAQAASAAGVGLGVLHSLLALHFAYDWDHARAVAVAASRAEQVYGIAWSGSVYANYVFLAWWAAETLWWWQSPRAFFRRPVVLEGLWRLLVFAMVVNGAVIFASATGRIAGVPLVAGLLWVWRPRRLTPALPSY